MRLLRMLFLLIVSAAAAPAIAGPFEDGNAAYQRGDYAKALRLWRPLAENGNARAQWGLGAMYNFGWGVTQDYAAAVSWYRKAADQGDAFAQSSLGFMYYEGRGLPQDYLQAHMWLNLAASRFDASEKEGREQATKSRDIVAARMTPVQLAEAQRLASKWRPARRWW